MLAESWSTGHAVSRPAGYVTVSIWPAPVGRCGASQREPSRDLGAGHRGRGLGETLRTRWRSGLRPKSGRLIPERRKLIDGSKIFQCV